MTLILKNAELERLAQELATRAGQPLQVALELALRESLSRAPAGPKVVEGEEFRRIVREIQDEVAAMPDRGDRRSADELLGYNEHGIWD